MAKRKELGTQATKKKVVRASRAKKPCGAPASPATTPATVPSINALRLAYGKHGEGWCLCKWKWGADLKGKLIEECAYHADVREHVRNLAYEAGYVAGRANVMPPTDEVGAVASESERVATSNPSLISRLYTWATGR